MVKKIVLYCYYYSANHLLANKKQAVPFWTTNFCWWSFY